MSMASCANASARKGHHEWLDWSDRRHGDDDPATWHRRPWVSDTRCESDPTDHSDVKGHDPFDGLVAMVGGGAAATGDASIALGRVEAIAEDKGSYSIAVGEAVFEAWAWSEQPGGASAVADIYLDIANADFIFRCEIEASASGPNEAWARSEIDYFSIDFHGWSPPHGPIVGELGVASDVGSHWLEKLPGTFAGALVTAEALGGDTLSATFSGALAVENQFSLVQAMAMTAL